MSPKPPPRQVWPAGRLTQARGHWVALLLSWAASQELGLHSPRGPGEPGRAGQRAPRLGVSHSVSPRGLAQGWTRLLSVVTRRGLRPSRVAPARGPRSVGSACERSARLGGTSCGDGQGESVSRNHTPAHAASPRQLDFGKLRQGIKSPGIHAVVRSPRGRRTPCCPRVRSARRQVVGWDAGWDPAELRGAKYQGVPSATATQSGWAPPRDCGICV